MCIPFGFLTPKTFNLLLSILLTLNVHDEGYSSGAGTAYPTAQVTYARGRRTLKRWSYHTIRASVRMATPQGHRFFLNTDTLYFCIIQSSKSIKGMVFLGHCILIFYKK
jgi:hypothetical protein